MINNLRNGVSRAALVVVSLLCLSFAGCGGGSDGPERYPVKGTISFEGAPVQEGMVTFSDGNFSSSGMITTTGEFTLADDLPTGSYKVQVTPPDLQTAPTFGKTGEAAPQPKEVKNIPEKYRTLATTDLSADVTSGDNDVKLEMKGG